MNNEIVKKEEQRKIINICMYICDYYSITIEDIANKLNIGIYEFNVMRNKCPNRLLFELINLLNEMEGV